LTSLVGLQKLTLEHLGSPHDDAAPRGLPAALTALTSSLTQLSVHKFGLEGRQAQGLSRLTALQRLELVECQGEQELSSKWLTLLQQLTYLNLSGSPVKQLPKNLGQALPHLQVLLVANTWCGELPKGMTRLTRLDASMESSSELSDASLAAVCEATALRQLNLSGCGIKYASCLSALSALEVLQMQGSGSRGWEDDCDEDKSSSSTPPGDRLRWMCRLHDHLDYGTESGSDYDSYSSSSRRSLLPPTLPLLVNLRRLDLHNSEWWVSDLVTMGGFQHLTFLDLSSGLAREGGESGAGGLPVLGVLPALQQLDLSCVGVDGHQWPAVGAWLGRQPQLTRLSLSLSAQLDRPRDAQQQAAGLALLPTQLVELDLSHCELQQLPPRLSQMTNLKILLAGSNPGLPPQLPAWLPEVQQLEVVQVHDVGEGCMQLLRQLPRLRTFDSTEYEAYMALQPDLRRELPHLLASSYCPRLFPEAPV
jgi:Leucine-rich repeat (LRR) protein